jgi:two-component system chemotaxis sensor kinase CheA
MSSDAEAMWQQFLVEANVALDDLLRVCALKRPDAETLAGLAGRLFDFRTACALCGLDGAAVPGGYAEELVVACAEGRSFADVRDALAELGRVLKESFAALSTPDLSGARIDDFAPIQRATARLAELLPESETAPEEVSPAPEVAAPSDDESLWVPAVDDDMIEPFLEEAAERTEALSQKLLALESRPGDTELVREIFRDLHTVKGSSGFVGLRRMNRLAHAAEDLVGQVRAGTRAVDRGVVDALLGALDGLKAILAAAQKGATGAARKSGVKIDVDVEGAIARVRMPGVVSSSPSPSPSPSTTTSTSTSTSGVDARQTLRVDFEKLDGLLNLVGELVLAKSGLHTDVASLTALGRELDGQLRRARSHKTFHAALDDLERFQRIYGELSSDLSRSLGGLDHVSGEMRQQVMKLRMLPIGRVFTKYHRTVRELAHGLGKQARLEVVGAETELDKVLIEQLDEPLLHLVRNALDHGLEMPAERKAAGKPEEGIVTLSARHRGNQIIVEISDDGAGIDPEKLRKKALEKSLATPEELETMDGKQVLDLIFRPGFSTAARVTDLSGRGVGMDVVRATIHKLSGSIEISSEPGRGTTFTLKLPLTLAIVQVLLVRVGGDELAIPLDVVERTLTLRPEELHSVYDRDLLLLGERQIPLLWLADALELEAPLALDGELPVVLVDASGETYGLIVERLGEKREIVLKTFGDLIGQIPCAAGATLIGDRVALVLDVVQAVQRGLQRADGSRTRTRTNQIVHAHEQQSDPTRTNTRARPRVLVAEDSDLIREGLRRLLEAHGCDVVQARDGAEALALAEKDTVGFDLVSTDVMMPQLDGYQLTRALRAHPRHKDVPIVMVTSRSEHIDRVRGFDAGVDEYLTKPLDSGELVRAVERHLKRKAT